MMVIDERFEKVWKLPWVLGGIIHGYLWDREDLLNITSKVKSFVCIFIVSCHFLDNVRTKGTPVVGAKTHFFRPK